MTGEALKVALVGHPFAPIGRGEDVRCAFRALAGFGADVSLIDVYGTPMDDADLHSEFDAALGNVHERTAANIFFINGDEVEASLVQVEKRLPKSERNIICPAWELPQYPACWHAAIERFDEVWAPSTFIADGLNGRTRVPVRTIPLAVEPRARRLVGRAHFGIPGSSYVFLFFFDFKSYVARKNPQGVMKAFQRLVLARPFADLRLVVKTHNGHPDSPAYGAFLKEAAALKDQLIVLDQTMEDWEVKSLVRASDCFVSLHRSEGFGRGLAESMYFGKPVIATGYSGNLDFMRSDNSILVPHQMVGVGPGQYPQGEGQSWADPDERFAVDAMIRLVDDPLYGRRLGRAGQLSVRANLSYLAVGRKCMEALERG